MERLLQRILWFGCMQVARLCKKYLNFNKDLRWIDKGFGEMGM
jgi:hypothetical protein